MKVQLLVLLAAAAGAVIILVLGCATTAVTLEDVWIEEPGYCGERPHIAGNIFVYANKYFRLAGSYRVEDGLIRATVDTLLHLRFCRKAIRAPY